MDYSSEKIKIKQEQTYYCEDNCSIDCCDEKNIKEELVEPGNNGLTYECELRDNIGPSHFKFVTPADIKEEDTDESSMIESICDPISMKEGMYYRYVLDRFLNKDLIHSPIYNKILRFQLVLNVRVMAHLDSRTTLIDGIMFVINKNK